MLKPNTNSENMPSSKDISQEFLSMSDDEFNEFLETQKGETDLSIAIDWKDEETARRLVDFLKWNTGVNQMKSAIIRTNRKQYVQALDVFTAGVIWEDIEEN